MAKKNHVPGKLLQDKRISIRLNNFQYNQVIEISKNRKIRPTNFIRDLVIDAIIREAKGGKEIKSNNSIVGIQKHKSKKDDVIQRIDKLLFDFKARHGYVAKYIYLNSDDYVELKTIRHDYSHKTKGIEFFRGIEIEKGTTTYVSGAKF